MSYKKLLRLYKNSSILPFGREEKIVILSDIHRGDGSYSDSLIGNKNIYLSALNYYYKEGYTLIEAGDGDELWKNKSFIDIAYNHKDIFKVLNKFNNKKRLHLLYGNHDSKKASKDFLLKQKKKLLKIDENFGKDFIYLLDNIIYKESLILKYLPLDKNIFIFHGHQLDFMNYEFSFLSKFLVRHIWEYLEGTGFKAPTSPANNYKKGGKVDKRLEEWSLKNNLLIICGHTHKSRFPKANEGSYFNDGCCVLPYSISTIEINLGLISLVKWSIEPKEKDNVLYIKRSFLGGPEKLDEYLK